MLESSKDVLTVPYDAIQTDEEGNSFVYVQDIDSSDESGTGRKKIDVTVGLEGDYYVEVSGEGLEEGMRVILSGTGASGGDSGSVQMDEMPDMSGGMPDSMPGGMGGGAPGGMGGGPGGGM